jgi:N-acyl-D-amino-acid deacylase
VSICSDSEAIAATDAFVGSPTHPRAYGAFARFLGRYVRDEGLVTVAEAVRRMTSLPADTFGLAARGRLEDGAFADVAVFDLEDVRDNASFGDPHRYATGTRHVLVNGVPVVRDHQLTHALPGRALKRGRPEGRHP